MIRTIKTFDHWLQVLTTFLHYVSNGLLFFIMLMISFDVIWRNIFNRPLTGAFEMTELGSALLVFFSLAITHQYKEHISIGFIVDKMSAKVKGLVLGMIEIGIFIILIVMSNQLFSNAARVMGRNTTTSDLSLPIYPFLYLSAFAAIVFAFVALSSGLKYWIKAVDKS